MGIFGKISKKIAPIAAGLLALGACENIPPCLLDESCEILLASPSTRDFSSEPHRVIKKSNRQRLGLYYQVSEVLSPYHYPEGTVVIDTPRRVLYLMKQSGLAMRYPIAVGRQGYSFAGHAEIGFKKPWPDWRPTPDMIEEDPELPEVVEPGTRNPLGARALYLFSNGNDTLYRVHGTNNPNSIGHEASAGCIRMYNEDVIDLYERVPIGAKVVVIGKANGEEIDQISDKKLVEEIDDPVYDLLTGRKRIGDFVNADSFRWLDPQLWSIDRANAAIGTPYASTIATQ